MLQNPFLTLPQVESPQSRSWAMGFAFGFQGPAQSTMTPAEIQPEDADAFNLGVLAGQDASINGLSLAQACVDLNSEGPSVPHFVTDVVGEGGMAVFSAAELGFHLSGAVAEGILLVVNLSIALETFSDDPDTALEQQAGALQQQLQRVGIENSMELFIGGAVDPSVLGCELMLTSIFRSQDAAANAARALMRPKWLVAAWRSDQSNGIHIVTTGTN